MLGSASEQHSDDSIYGLANPFVNEVIGGQNYVQDLDVGRDGCTVYGARCHLTDVVAIDFEIGDLLWETEPDGLCGDHQVMSDDGRFVYIAVTVWKIDTATTERVGLVCDAGYLHGNHLHDLPGMGNCPTLVKSSLVKILAPDATDCRHRPTFLNP